MFEYPSEIFGAKMREEKFGVGEDQYILYRKWNTCWLKIAEQFKEAK